MASRACWCGVQARVSGAGRRVAQPAMASARASTARRATQGSSVARGAKWRGMGAAVRGLRLGGRLVPRARLAAVGGRLAGPPLPGVEDDGAGVPGLVE